MKRALAIFENTTSTSTHAPDASTAAPAAETKAEL